MVYGINWNCVKNGDRRLGKLSSRKKNLFRTWLTEKK
jgi:hypothetical protein